MIGELGFAFLLGTVATANPCGFALLPAYLARRLGVDGNGVSDTGDALLRAFAVGALTTAGFLVVFGVAGGAISLGAFWLTVALPWAGLVIGLVLAAMGVAVLAGRGVRINLPMAKPAASGSGLRGNFLFGIGYGVASLSCTLPLFLTVTGTAITGGIFASAFSFAAYALGMGTILTALAVGAALSRSGVAAVTGSLLPYVNRASGALLLLAGLYVVYFWAYAVVPLELPAQESTIAMGERLSGALRGWLSASAGQTALYGLLSVLLALLVWIVWRRIAFALSHREWATTSEGTRDGGNEHAPGISAD
jgi:cytochrome c biogenesis protein CcdA